MNVRGLSWGRVEMRESRFDASRGLRYRDRPLRVGIPRNAMPLHFRSKSIKVNVVVRCKVSSQLCPVPPRGTGGTRGVYLVTRKRILSFIIRTILLFLCVGGRMGTEWYRSGQVQAGDLRRIILLNQRGFDPLENSLYPRDPPTGF